MYIDIVPNRKSPPAILLRKSIRDGKKIVKRTIANLSSLSIEQAEAIRAVLKGKALAPADEVFEIICSRAHGGVNAIGSAMTHLRVASLLDRKPSRERDLVLAMIAARVLDPRSKLATARSWGHSTLGEWFGVEGADEDTLYAAMDWLLERQDGIEQHLAKRHLGDGARVLYDLSSSYFEGECCPLARRGYSRDAKKGKLQVNYGLLSDARGCPVAISVFEGNTSDPKTLLPQVEKLQRDFSLASVILVGDRGMISQKQIDVLSERAGVQWISALKSGAIRKLLDAGAIRPDLFDERNLFDCTHADFPGERLVACRNPQLAQLRTNKRRSPLEATCKELEKVRDMVADGRLQDIDKIGVRAHLFLCMLAYYVKWHMSEAWRELLFADEDQQRLAERDPVAPATRSEAALAKVATKALNDGSPAHSFRTLLNELATIVRNTCRRSNADAAEQTFDIDTTPNAKQRKALDLINAIRP